MKKCAMASWIIGLIMAVATVYGAHKEYPVNMNVTIVSFGLASCFILLGTYCWVLSPPKTTIKSSKPDNDRHFNIGG